MTEMTKYVIYQVGKSHPMLQRADRLLYGVIVKYLCEFEAASLDIAKGFYAAFLHQKDGYLRVTRIAEPHLIHTKFEDAVLEYMRRCTEGIEACAKYLVEKNAG